MLARGWSEGLNSMFKSSMFSRSLMCCRLQPVSSRLSSASGRQDSSREWAFRRSLGLDDTQHEAVFPMAGPAGAAPVSSGGGGAASPWAAGSPRRPGGLSAAEERPRPRDCGRPDRLTPPPPWRAPRSRLRFPVGPAPSRRPQTVPVQGARPLGTRGGGADAGSGDAAAGGATLGPGLGGGRRWARPAAPATLPSSPRPPCTTAPPSDPEAEVPTSRGRALRARTARRWREGLTPGPECGASAAGWGAGGGGWVSLSLLSAGRKLDRTGRSPIPSRRSGTGVHSGPGGARLPAGIR